MNLRVATLALALRYAPASAQTCGTLTGKFQLLDLQGPCTYDKLVAEYASQVYMATGALAECAAGEVSTATAQSDFDLKLEDAYPGMSAEDAATQLCHDMYDTQAVTPFGEAFDVDTNDPTLHFEQKFYNGQGPWQEEVETIYETDDQTPTSRLREDARHLREFYLGDGSYSKVEWPNQLTQFEDSTCTMNAAMCCWPRDRQANDGNGNCATPYDENCQDNDPADNTNLCFADLKDGNDSSGFNSDLGFMSFPDDNNAGEGAIHCHGFAWSDDPYHHTARYKSNNLFFVSGYDHLHQRGYAKNIPGMPMCGCMDQMPMATRSDCTQVDLTEDWHVEFDGQNFKGVMDKIEIDFNACVGRGGRRNDLWTYHARLYDEGHADRRHFGATGRKLTNDHDCYFQTEHQKALKGVVPTYQHKEEDWTIVVGRDEMHYPPMTEISFGVAAAHSSTVDTGFIVLRTCPNCAPDHKKIYYKRLTPLPDGFDLVKNFWHHRSSGPQVGNKWKVDFNLYSTYEEAVEGDLTKAWKCRNDAFNYHAAFYGECSPEGNRVTNQYSYWTWYPGPQPTVAYFVNAPQDAGISDYDVRQRSSSATSGDIGYPGVPGFVKESADGIHVAGSGDNIGGSYDQFHYMSEPYSGDIDVRVHVTDMANPGNHASAKAGILLRANREPNSMYAYALMTYGEGVKMQYRRSQGGGAGTSGTDPKVNVDDAWLRIVKKMETVEFYRSDDDGASWILQGTETLFFPEDTFHVGLAVSSKHNGYLAEATFADYDVAQYVFPTSAPSVSSAPTLWNPNKDIGDPEGAGSFWVQGEYEYVQGGGKQIYGTDDEFFFRNEQMSLADLSAIELYISNFDNGYQNSRGGIMVRQDDTPDSPHVFVGAAGADLGVEFQSRSAKGERAVVHAIQYVNHWNKFWVRLERNGDEFKALYRVSEADEWIVMEDSNGDPKIVTVSFDDTIQVGRAVSAGRTDRWHNKMQTKHYSVEKTT
ncbi:hypothetical protein ACHAWF_013875 [Thalassiosira exigua]